MYSRWALGLSIRGCLSETPSQLVKLMMMDRLLLAAVNPHGYSESKRQKTTGIVYSCVQGHIFQAQGIQTGTKLYQ